MNHRTPLTGRRKEGDTPKRSVCRVRVPGANCSGELLEVKKKSLLGCERPVDGTEAVALAKRYYRQAPKKEGRTRRKRIRRVYERERDQIGMIRPAVRHGGPLDDSRLNRPRI